MIRLSPDSTPRDVQEREVQSARAPGENKNDHSEAGAVFGDSEDAPQNWLGSKSLMLDANVLAGTRGTIESTRNNAGDLDQYRNVISQITDDGCLMISGRHVAEDGAAMRAAGVTHVVNLAGIQVKNLEQDGRQYLTMYLRDNKDADIEMCLYPCVNFIHEAIEQGGRVLVHCMEGVSRSATVVIAYLMVHLGMAYKEASAVVLTRREIANPNIGFTMQLFNLDRRLQGSRCGGEEDLKARRNSAGASKVRIFEVTAVFKENEGALFAKHTPYLLLEDFNPDTCYVVHHNSSVFIWTGSRATAKAKAVAATHARNLIQFEGAGGVAPTLIAEGATTAAAVAATDETAEAGENISTVEADRVPPEVLASFQEAFQSVDRQSSLAAMREDLLAAVTSTVTADGSVAGMEKDGGGGGEGSKNKVRAILRKEFQKYDVDRTHALTLRYFSEFYESCAGRTGKVHKPDLKALFFCSGGDHTHGTIDLDSFLDSLELA